MGIIVLMGLNPFETDWVLFGCWKKIGVNMKLNKRNVEGVPLESGKAKFYFDDELTGFGLKVTSRAKIYIVQSRVKGQKVRVTLGRHGALTAEQARVEAQKQLGQMAGGANPNEEKRKQEQLGITLRELYVEYRESRIADGGLRPKTLSVYESALRRCFGDWLDKPAASITKEMVLDRFREIATTKGPRSKEGGARAQAAQSMRVLRSILNFGALSYEDVDGKSLLPANPVKRLSQKHRNWSRVAPRNDVIDPTGLAPWYQAVVRQANTTVGDYLLFCLFTGLRRSAAATLKWSSFNERAKTITVLAENDKMGKEQRLPLSDFALDMLKRRGRVRDIKNEYIFPGDVEGQPINEPKRVIEKVVTASGVKFSMHTLRRTFATTAERLDISYYKVKQLLNHAVSGDVTGNHYVQIDVEQLREPMQLIANYFKQQMEISQSQSASHRRSGE